MTTTLPRTTIEAEARAHASAAMANLRDGDFLGLGVDVLHPEAGRINLRRMLKQVALNHPLRMMWVIDNARAGWDDADLALRELAIEIVDRGEALPTALGAYVME